jgi:hypothetical protein
LVRRHLAQAPPDQQQQQQDAFDMPDDSHSNSTADAGGDLVSSPKPQSANNDTFLITLPPVEAAAAACTQPQALSAGLAVTGIPTSPNFSWPRCASNRTQLIWIAKLCSIAASGRYADNSSSSSSVQFVELRAVLRSSGKIPRF